MGNSKDNTNKSTQLLNAKWETSSVRISAKPIKNDHQVYMQQSVTLLALKDKSAVNGTLAPDLLQPKLLFGVLAEDLPLLIGAVIGAALVIALSVLILAFWKCCCRMTILSKKKQYWLQPNSSTSVKGKYKVPVIQSNSVVFLGLNSTQALDYKSENSSEDCIITKFVANPSNDAFETVAFGNPLHYAMTEQCPDIIVSDMDKPISEDSSSLPNRNRSDNAISQSCSVISVSPLVNNRTVSNCTTPSIQSSKGVNIPSIAIHRDSPPAFFRRNFYSGTFDQHSLYSWDSNRRSEFELKRNSYSWSNYSLRPASSSDCYYDLFQKANFCKKRKNRMRSDIAAAIALNRSQSPQLNKDTELLVENAVEVILDERTPL